MTVIKKMPWDGGRGMPQRATGSIGAEGVRKKTWVRFSPGFHGTREAGNGKEASDWLV